MSRNVEIKASVADLTALLKRASELCDPDYPWRNKGKRIAQRDIFFHSTNGRMKLRRLETEVSPHSPSIFIVGQWRQHRPTMYTQADVQKTDRTEIECAKYSGGPFTIFFYLITYKSFPNPLARSRK